MFKRSLLIGGKGYLQTFADGDPTPEPNGNGGGEPNPNGGQNTGNGNPEPNSTDFDSMLKDNPDFKNWYTQRFGADFSQRTKKLRDDQGNLIDADEYWKLKADADQRKQEQETEAERFQRERDDALARLANVDKAEKRLAVREHALNNGYDSKLVARLMETELDSLQLVDGQYTGITEAIDGLAKEFPQIKAQTNEPNPEPNPQGGYNSGDPNQRGNNPKPADKYSKGAERARARHGK